MKLSISIAYDISERNSATWRVSYGASSIAVFDDRVYVLHEYECNCVQSDVSCVAGVAMVAALCPSAVSARLILDGRAVLDVDVTTLRDQLVALEGWLAADDELRHCVSSSDELILVWVSGETAYYRVLPASLYAIIAEYEANL